MSTTDAIGTSDRVRNGDFLGLLDGISPELVNGGRVVFNGRPTNEPYMIGDIVGRDIDETNGSTTWQYQLTLPTDAAAGTGFENISFDGFAFENLANNLEGNDQLNWELMLNGVAVSSVSPGAGVDFDTFVVALANAGGSSISSVGVRMTVTGFSAGPEWFVTRGELTASYTTAIPEPASGLSLALSLVLGLIFGRNRRNHDMAVAPA